MVLPIIVPGWEVEPHHWPAIACQPLPPRQGTRPQSARLDAAREVRGGNAHAMRSEPMAGPDSAPLDEAAKRLALVRRWRAVSHLSPLKRPKTLASTRSRLAGEPASVEFGINLLAICEWHLRRRMRQEWDTLGRANRGQVLALINRFARSEAVIDSAALTEDAATWTLFAMYWCGASHPAALFQNPLHPPTGLVRWISQFHVVQQATQTREIQGLFVDHMSVTTSQCGLLVRRMAKRTGQVALLAELCDF